MRRWSIWRRLKGNADRTDSVDRKSNEDKVDSMDNRDITDEMVNGNGTGGSMDDRGCTAPGDALDETVNTLITAILKCEEYLAYRAELDKVLQVPELKAQIDEYRRRNYQLQSSTDIDFEKLDRFEKEYEDFRSDPLVSEFLAAELAFCKRMQEIESRVTAELDFQ